jgi:sulfite exporter TauE/SafE
MIEETLAKENWIDAVKVFPRKNLLEISCADAISKKQVQTRANALLKPLNYSLRTESSAEPDDFMDLIPALLLGLAFLGGFYLLQQSGLVDFGFAGELTASTAFFVGVVASLSSCLAVVGGLILSLSAKIAQDTKTVRPFILFHLSRLLGFLLLGALIGFLGKTFAINYTLSAWLGILAALVMVILGVNLLGIFSFTKNFGLSLPKSLNKKILQIEKGALAPVFLGVLSFFLPCGFTQSMQFAALASGSYLQGATIMFAFALGTLPMLLLISFGSYGFAQSRFAKIFFKSSGVAVIGFGLISLLASFRSFGYFL